MNYYLINKLINANAKNFIGSIFRDEEKIKIKENKQSILMLGMPVSTACNLKCKFCYTNTHKNSKTQLSFEKRLQLINEAKDLGIKTIITAMSGEAFCDVDFFKIIDYTYANNLNYIIFTNLTLISKNIAKKLFEYQVGILGSCHSLTEKIYEDLTQTKGSFKMMMEGSINLLEAGYSSSNFIISWVVCKKNHHEGEKMIEFWRENGIKVFPEYCNITGFGNEFIEELYYPYEKYLILKNNLNKKYPFYDIQPPLTVNNKCYSSEYGIIIGIDGTVYPCWDSGYQANLGNINDNTLQYFVNKKFTNPCFCSGYDECIGRNLFLKNNLE